MSSNLEIENDKNIQPIESNIQNNNNSLVQKIPSVNKEQMQINKKEEENINSNKLNSTSYKENFSNQNKEIYKNDINNNTINGFNPMTHVPPKYDIYGYLKPVEKRREDMSILTNKDKIKIPWCEKNSNLSGAMTQKELIEKRKKERIPDISYDLDQDGYVGGRDYVIAKRYDVDNDGKLNEQEKKAAYEGIINKIEENYVWNIDKFGAIKPLRLLQKRGKFIDAEDFLPVAETYPKHPISDIKPHCSTFTELKNLRKNENITNINNKLIAWEKTHTANFYDGQIIGDSNKPKIPPKYTSMNQIKAEKNRNNRIKCGLSPETTDNRNNVLEPPSLKYIYNPKHKTKGEIDEDYHKENYMISKKLNSKKHKTDIERLNEREDEIFAN